MLSNYTIFDTSVDLEGMGCLEIHLQFLISYSCRLDFHITITIYLFSNWDKPIFFSLLIP